MKFPEEIILKLKNDTTIVCKLKNQIFDKWNHRFEVTLEITEDFKKLNNDCVEFTTEEK